MLRAQQAVRKWSNDGDSVRWPWEGPRRRGNSQWEGPRAGPRDSVVVPQSLTVASTSEKRTPPSPLWSLSSTSVSSSSSFSLLLGECLNLPVPWFPQLQTGESDVITHRFENVGETRACASQDGHVALGPRRLQLMVTSLQPPVSFQSISVKNKLAKCSVVSWTGSGKRTFVETLVTSKSSLEFTMINVPMLCNVPQLCKMM